MQMPRQTSIHCQHHGILYLKFKGVCALYAYYVTIMICALYAYYVTIMMQKLSAPVVSLFYLKF